MLKFEIETEKMSKKEIKVFEEEIKALLGNKLVKIKNQVIDIEEISNEDHFKCSKIDYSKPVNEWLKDMDDAREKIFEINDKVIKEGKITGRFIQIPAGDGYAYYQILLRKANKVLVSVVTGLGDDWTVPDLGVRSMVEFDRIKSYLMRGSNDKLFGV